MNKVGVGLILLGLFLLGLVFWSYTKLWQKPQLAWGPEIQGTVSDLVRPPVLPVFSGLRGQRDPSGPIYLTIAKLGLNQVPIDLDVVVDNLRPDYLKRLTTSLGHLAGSARPGQAGNSLVFGHSALPYLYNRRNFQTLFTKLDELKFGDVIEVVAVEKIYRYKVEAGGLLAKTVTLADLSSQKARLTLLTCYPPGFKSEKYAVRALLYEEVDRLSRLRESMD